MNHRRTLARMAEAVALLLIVAAVLIALFSPDPSYIGGAP